MQFSVSVSPEVGTHIMVYVTNNDLPCIRYSRILYIGNMTSNPTSMTCSRAGLWYNKNIKPSPVLPEKALGRRQVVAKATSM